MRWGRTAAIAGPVAALLLLRFLALRSSPHLVYHGEFVGIGRLQHEVATGTFQFHTFAGFVHDHSYQYFAQGTVLLQVVAAALHPIFGPTLSAQWAAASLMEGLTVGLLAATLARLTTPGMATLGALLLALPPRFVAFFAMQPYGNHSEMVFLPMAMAWWLAGPGPGDLRLRRAVPLALGLVASVLFYRLNVVPALALLAVLGADGRRGLRFAVVAGGLAAAGLVRSFLWLGLQPSGRSYDGLGSFPADRPVWDGVSDALMFLWRRGLAGLEFGDGGATHRVLLLSGVGAAAWVAWRSWGARGDGTQQDASGLGSSAHRVAAFAALWAAGALAAPVLGAAALDRYWIPAFAACTLALGVAAAVSRGGWRLGMAGLFAALALAGFMEVRPYVDTATWERTAAFPGAELWWVLEVNSLDLDELPYYQRLIDEGRGSPAVGLASHIASNDCPVWPGSRQEAPQPSADLCHGWGEGELVATFEREAGRLADPAAQARALRDAGRGVWIRADRSLERVELALKGASPSILAAAMEGARDEAGRWGGL